MIVFNLGCENSHRFEGWFASAEDYSGQKTRGLVGCPTCGSLEVDRVPSATRINTGAPAPVCGGDDRRDAEGLGPGPVTLALAFI